MKGREIVKNMKIELNFALIQLLLSLITNDVKNNKTISYRRHYSSLTSLLIQEILFRTTVYNVVG